MPPGCCGWNISSFKNGNLQFGAENSGNCEPALLIISSLVMNYYTLIIIDISLKVNVLWSFFCCLLVMNWEVSALHLWMEWQIFVVEGASYVRLCAGLCHQSKVNINEDKWKINASPGKDRSLLISDPSHWIDLNVLGVSLCSGAVPGKRLGYGATCAAGEGEPNAVSVTAEPAQVCAVRDTGPGLHTHRGRTAQQSSSPGKDKRWWCAIFPWKLIIPISFDKGTLYYHVVFNYTSPYISKNEAKLNTLKECLDYFASERIEAFIYLSVTFLGTPKYRWSWY